MEDVLQRKTKTLKRARRLFARKRLLASLVVLCVSGFSVGAYALTSPPATKSKKPNIVFILTDDQSTNLDKFTPKTNQLIKAQGMSFTNYFDSASLCCVARSSIIRGQYSHNTKIDNNGLPSGGFGHFFELGEENSTIATWMHNAGYDTSLMGKYLNGYPSASNSGPATSVPDTYIPPGWSDWFVPVQGDPYGEYNYTVNDNGKKDHYGHDPKDYMVDVISRRAASFINRHDKSSSKPFFMYVAPYSPHAPYTPAPRYKDTVHSKYPRTPAYDEADLSDKPSAVTQQPRLTAKQRDQIDHFYQKRAESMKGVDDLVKNIYDTLKKTGQLNNTYLVFTSDNGFHMGEHGLSPGKYTPYETDIHLPLYVRGRGITPGSKNDSLTGNIDLASTFAELAGAKIPSFVDGKSMAPLLVGVPQNGRKYYLLERQPSRITGVDPNENAGSIEEPVEPKLVGRRSNSDYFVPFVGVRSSDGYVYARYSTGEEELYDLHADPYELHNLLSTANKPRLDAAHAAVLAQLKQALVKLEACAGSNCTI